MTYHEETRLAVANLRATADRTPAQAYELDRLSTLLRDMDARAAAHRWQLANGFNFTERDEARSRGLTALD